MNLLQLLKYLLNLIRGYGVDIRFLPGLEAKIYRLRAQKKSKIKLKITESLVKDYPDQPIAHLELATTLHQIQSVKQF